MNASQLAQVPIETLEQAIQNLTTENNQEITLLRQLQAFNAAMCARLAKLNNQCPTQAYLSAPVTNTLSCPNSKNIEPSIQVIAKNLNGHRFRIVANTHYISDEFGEGGGNVRFHRDDTQPVNAPRFREIVSLKLVSVTAGSVINSSGYIQSTQVLNATDQAYLIKNMQLNIIANGQNITGKGSLIIQAPSSPTNLTELQIDPQAILLMGKSSSCMVSMSEINQIRQSTLSGSTP